MDLQLFNHTTNLILAISSIVTFGSYLAYTLAKFGLTKSISKTYYYLKEKRKWIFRAATWAYSITLGLAGGTWLTYGAAALISLVGFTPDTKGKDKEHEEKIHVVGATGGIVVMCVQMVTTGHWYLPAILAAFSAPAMIASLKDHTWWIEVLAYVLSAWYILTVLI